MKKSTALLQFKSLQKKHGESGAILIVENLENLVYFEERKRTLLSTPSDRFIDALEKLTTSAVNKNRLWAKNAS